MNVSKFILSFVIVALTFTTGCSKMISAEDDQVETPIDIPVTIFLTGSANYDLYQWDEYVVTPPEHGSLSGTGYKRVYTPNPGFSGIDTIGFRLVTEGNTTGEAVIRVHVGDLTNRIDRYGFSDYSLRACAKESAEKSKATFVSELRSINCSGSTLLVGGVKFFWLNDVFDNCLNCDYGIKVASLEGIQAFTQLTTISIDKGSLSNLAPLASLDNLTALHLPSVAGDQASEFSKLQSLRSLSFSSPTLNDFYDIAELRSLESLSIKFSSETGFDSSSLAAADWANLEQLSLSGPLAHLNGLGFANLVALTELSLSVSGATDLGGLNDVAVPALEQLSMYFSTNQSLQNFTGNAFSNLRTLTISGANLVDFSALTGNTYPLLESLTLGSFATEATDLSGTENLVLPKLSLVDLQGLHRLTDVSAILTWQLPVVETIILTRAQNTLPCSELARMEAQFPNADIQTNTVCLE